MPKGYIVAEFDVTGQDDWKTYSQKVPETLKPYNGRFLVWAGASRMIEGDGKKGSLVVIEFDSPKRAMEWYNSSDYQAILPIRLRNATGRVFCVAGTQAAQHNDAGVHVAQGAGVLAASVGKESEI